jgi:hypothetical protein
MKYFALRRCLLFILAGLLMLTSGCRYLANRYYDFRDIFSVGVGITAENKVTGIMPASLGAYVEVTDLLQCGAITFNGDVAELDLRGAYAGPESSTRIGFLWWQMLRINQAYEDGCFNAFKNQEFPWCYRMESIDMRNHAGKPAKRLHYEHWAMNDHEGTLLLHRGWQYWEYIGAQLGICDPFVTHFGVMARVGFDLSEVSDFLLGWVGIDFKHDDMSADEWTIFTKRADTWGLKLVPAKPNCPPEPLSDEESTSTQSEENGAKPAVHMMDESTSVTTTVNDE